MSLVKFFIVERWFTMQNKDIVHKVVVRIKYNLYDFIYFAPVSIKYVIITLQQK